MDGLSEYYVFLGVRLFDVLDVSEDDAGMDVDQDPPDAKGDELAEYNLDDYDNDAKTSSV